MTFEEIIKNWEEDSQIDPIDLGGESIKIPRLHNKYYKIILAEKSLLMRLQADMKVLKLEKYEFYSQGHTEETKKKGWKLPPKGMILKADIPMYLDADEDMIALSLKIGMQQEKLEFLESIVKTLMNRNFLIKNAIDHLKFINGN